MLTNGPRSSNRALSQPDRVVYHVQVINIRPTRPSHHKLLWGPPRRNRNPHFNKRGPLKYRTRFIPTTQNRFRNSIKMIEIENLLPSRPIRIVLHSPQTPVQFQNRPPKITPHHEIRTAEALDFLGRETDARPGDDVSEPLGAHEPAASARVMGVEGMSNLGLALLELVLVLDSGVGREKDRVVGFAPDYPYGAFWGFELRDSSRVRKPTSTGVEMPFTNMPSPRSILPSNTLATAFPESSSPRDNNADIRKSNAPMRLLKTGSNSSSFWIKLERDVHINVDPGNGKITELASSDGPFADSENSDKGIFKYATAAASLLPHRKSTSLILLTKALFEEEIT
ncbi:ATPase E1-E2 type family protein / haloaciddehalogenase-like hydrolase family protein [Striga asiatica]|uniref:ATPase E1-E2 type family protein / haloaciddehalogenase-like hydrolase family protein n=1 Tax=Striga asiatica TaxID=4170 RepID=A0A5A7PYK1_STRAF|nr:ATPase E1-E2 type family protein / haloaciddehalogenase-like hydrolase family protein [Striga asiatica]